MTINTDTHVNIEVRGKYFWLSGGLQKKMDTESQRTEGSGVSGLRAVFHGTGVVWCLLKCGGGGIGRNKGGGGRPSQPGEVREVVRVR